MRAATVCLLATTSSAHADDALQARARVEAEKTWLELDLTDRPPSLQGLAAQHQVTRDTLAIDRRTTLLLELDQWSNQDGTLPALDQRGQGFTATARLVRDLGFATLTLRGAYAAIDTPIGDGRYHELGVSLLRTIERKGGKRAWFGISANRRDWHGEATPPGGELDDFQLLFVVGWTF